MISYTKNGLVAVTIAAPGIGACAAIDMENESAALVQMKVSIAPTEQHINGKATRAELEQPMLD